MCFFPVHQIRVAEHLGVLHPRQPEPLTTNNCWPSSAPPKDSTSEWTESQASLQPERNLCRHRSICRSKAQPVPTWPYQPANARFLPPIGRRWGTDSTNEHEHHTTESESATWPSACPHTTAHFGDHGTSRRTTTGASTALPKNCTCGTTTHFCTVCTVGTHLCVATGMSGTLTKN